MPKHLLVFYTLSSFFPARSAVKWRHPHYDSEKCRVWSQAPVSKLIRYCLNLALSFKEIDWEQSWDRMLCLWAILLWIYFILSSYSSCIPLFWVIRSCREELQAWGGGPNPEHHHGPEGPHEDQREEQTRDLWADTGSVCPRQVNTRHTDEADQTERAWRDV